MTLESVLTDKYRRSVTTQTVAWTWGTPDPETIQEYTYSALLPEQDILIHRFEMDDRDRILGFAMMHMTKGPKSNEQVIRIDTRHSEVHLHQFGCGNVQLARRVLRIIREQRDVEVGYDEALDVITENWEEHKRRWQRGH